MNGFGVFDAQMTAWATRLQEGLSLTTDQSTSFASAMAAELRKLDPTILSEIKTNPVPIDQRLDELLATARFMDELQRVSPGPHFVRAQVQVQNYAAFVYAGDYLFKPLRQAPSGSVTRAAARFLTDNPVRAFRNSIAHGNWCYAPDFGGLRFWAREGGEKDEPIKEWSVRQDELSFWQALGRCTAYTVLLVLSNRTLSQP